MQYIYDITWEDGSGDFGAGNPRELFWNGDVAIHAEGIYEIANLHRNAPELEYILDNIPKDRYSSPVCAVGGISVSSKSRESRGGVGLPALLAGTRAPQDAV